MLALLPCLFALSVLVQEPEPVALRAGWIDRAETTLLSSRSAIAERMDALWNLGFNAVLVPAWNPGLPLFTSNKFESVAGYAVDPAFGGRDVLGECIFEAHRAGLEVIAVFEGGLCCSAAGAGHLLLDKKPEWAALDRQQKPIVKDGLVALNALDPDVQRFFADVIRELLLRREVDGIAFDAGWPLLPIEGGYNPKSAQAYTAASHVPPSIDPQHEGWLGWRAKTVADALDALRKELRAIDPTLLFVFAPRAGTSTGVLDARSCFERGLFDLCLPRIEVRDAASLVKELEPFLALAGDPARLAPLLWVAEDATSELLVALVNVSRGAKFAGEALAPLAPLLADEAARFEPVRREPYYVSATLPWRKGVDWRPRVDAIEPFAGGGDWQWRTDAAGMRVLEIVGGQQGEASWTFRAPEAGTYELWTWISPDAELGSRVNYQVSTSGAARTNVLSVDRASRRGWVRVGDTKLKRHEERNVLTLSASEAEVTKVTSAGPLVLLLRRQVVRL